MRLQKNSTTIKHFKAPHSIQQFLKDSKGNTMVEVLTAFTILMIMAAMFTGVVQFTNNIIQKSKEIRQETDQLLEQYYLSESKGTGITGSQDMVLTDGKTSFKLNSEVYSYKVEDGNQVLYSFGQHKTITDEESDDGSTD